MEGENVELVEEEVVAVVGKGEEVVGGEEGGGGIQGGRGVVKVRWRGKGKEGCRGTDGEMMESRVKRIEGRDSEKWAEYNIL